MKKLVLFFMLLAFLISCGPSQRLLDLESKVYQNESKIQSLYNKEEYNPVIADSYITLMKMSTVVVRAERGKDTYRTAGFAVSTDEMVEGKKRDIVYVWTVAHAVTVIDVKLNKETGEVDYDLIEFKDIDVSFRLEAPLGRTKKAEILAYDLELDLALLRIDITDSGIIIPDIKFAEKRKRVGQPLVVVGHPGNRKWAMTEGLVSSYDIRIPFVDGNGSFAFSPKIMETTIDVSYGYSGSAVFDPMTGEIYGYVSRMVPDTKDALVFPVEYLIQFAVDNDFEYALPN